MNFKQINQNGLYEGFALITKSEKKVTAKGKDYLDLILSDSDGEISAKYWDYNEATQGQFPAETLVKVRGTISQYNGADQFRVERIRRATEQDGVDISEFVRSASYNSEYMFEKLVECVEEFQDKDLQKLVLHMLNEHKADLLKWPAAYRLHHAIRGGLLLHTLSIVRLCEGVFRREYISCFVRRCAGKIPIFRGGGNAHDRLCGGISRAAYIGHAKAASGAVRRNIDARSDMGCVLRCAFCRI